MSSVFLGCRWNCPGASVEASGPHSHQDMARGCDSGAGSERRIFVNTQRWNSPAPASASGPPADWVSRKFDPACGLQRIHQAGRGSVLFPPSFALKRPKARHLGVPPTRTKQLCRGDTASAGDLGHSSCHFWLNQADNILCAVTVFAKRVILTSRASTIVAGPIASSNF